MAGVAGSDVRAAWEAGVLPGWVVEWLIPVLFAARAWPGASESRLWRLREAWVQIAGSMQQAVDPTARSVSTTAAGWQSPAVPAALGWVGELFGPDAGTGEKSSNAVLLAYQSDGMAV